MVKLLITPLNIIYSYDMVYISSSKRIEHFTNLISSFFKTIDIHINNEDVIKFLSLDSDNLNFKSLLPEGSGLDKGSVETQFKEYIKKSLVMVPYVLKEYLTQMKENDIQMHLIYRHNIEKAIIKYELSCLELSDLFKDFIFIKDIYTYNPNSVEDKSIFITEEINDLLPLYSNNNIFLIYDHLIFKDSEDYLKLQQGNIEIISTKFKPDMTIESLRQLNNFIFYTNKDENANLDKKVIMNNFTSNSLKVLYFLDGGNKGKNYRKREIVITTDNILFIPFINKNFGMDLSLYDDFNVFLQRAPYFYLKNNEEICLKLDQRLKEKNVLIMHDFTVIDQLFYRYKVYLYIKSFIEMTKEKIEGLYNLKLAVPKCFSFDISDILESNYTSVEMIIHIKKRLINYLNENNGSITYPVVIKPDPCTEHTMFLIISSDGIDSFVNSENLEKIIKNYSKYIIQEFIPHDGVMFKTYFINEKSYTIQRPSLPNLEGKHLELKHFENKCFEFHNEFLYSKEDDSFFGQLTNEHKIADEINYEALDYICKLFAEIKGLTLFGLDYLYDRNTNTYYILEVNYFPSYRELKEKLVEEFNLHIINYHQKSNIK